LFKFREHANIMNKIQLPRILLEIIHFLFSAPCTDLKIGMSR